MIFKNSPPRFYPRTRLLDRPTGDIMVLLVTGTVCFGVLASGFIIAIISLVHPETDVSNWISRVSGIMNTMIGLLAGFLAGRTDMTKMPPVAAPPVPPEPPKAPEPPEPATQELDRP